MLTSTNTKTNDKFTLELLNKVAYVSHSNPNSFSPSDRDTICTARRAFALHGISAFALAGSLCVT